MNNDLSLPPPLNTKVYSAYGDREILARYCGLNSVPRHFRGEWQHGWVWPEYNCHPEMIVAGDGTSQLRKGNRYFVGRKDQLEALNDFGYTDVHDIGLPILYIPRPRTLKKNKSLLVMPAHSLPEREDNWSGEEFTKYVESYVKYFDEVSMCLSANCFHRDNWVNLKKLCTRVYIGAQESDINSLPRLATLFSQYEYVLTNDFGSHVPYAAFFGARVSVSGPRVPWKRDNSQRSQFYKNNPDCLDILEEFKTNDLLYKVFPHFDVEPPNGVNCEEWAAWQLGEDSVKPPKIIKELVGWDMVGEIRNFTARIYRFGTRIFHSGTRR